MNGPRVSRSSGRAGIPELDGGELTVRLEAASVGDGGGVLA
jgi:hypothetical protein